MVYMILVIKKEKNNYDIHSDISGRRQSPATIHCN